MTPIREGGVEIPAGMKLLNCPFCGTYPTMTGDFSTFDPSAGDPDDEAHHSSWGIMCLADACPVQPELDEPTQEEAVTAWNTRPPTPSPEIAEQPMGERWPDGAAKRRNSDGDVLHGCEMCDGEDECTCPDNVHGRKGAGSFFASRKPTEQPMGDLPATLSGHWTTEAGRDMAYATLDDPNMARNRLRLPDMQLANEVYLSPGIGNLTAAKERIRWLSASLAVALATSKPTPTDPFTTARNDIAGLPGHGMSADVQVAEQRVGEGSRFAQWTTADLAAQCRMQARDGLDPEYEQFMQAVSARLLAALPTPKPADPTSVEGERMRQIVRDYQTVADATFLSTKSRIEGGASDLEMALAVALGMSHQARQILISIDAALVTNAPDAAKREGGE